MTAASTKFLIWLRARVAARLVRMSDMAEDDRACAFEQDIARERARALREANRHAAHLLRR